MVKVAFEIRYNDGVFAERIEFTDCAEKNIAKKLDETIAEYNENPNVDYRITMENIKRIAYEDDYYTSATSRDYSPSNPWDAPGMSVKDFI